MLNKSNLNNALDSNWNVLKQYFPNDWSDLAKSTGAVSKVLFNFTTESMLRTIMLHAGKGYSLRETSSIVKSSNIANVSDVSILKALRRSEDWLRNLCQNLYFEQQENNLPNNSGGKKMRLVDGTVIKEQGKTGSQWRIHYSFSLPSMECDHFDLLSAKGAGNGENIQRIPVSTGDCMIADRGYSRIDEIFYVSDQNADIIVRVNQQALPFYDESAKKVQLLEKLKPLDSVGKKSSWDVYIYNDKGKKLKGRVCAIRKNRESILSAQNKLKRRASKNGNKLQDDTLEYAKYIIVFTTLSSEEYSTAEVLDWYRVRWQVELAFKRLKTLAGLGYLPKYDAKSSRAWLYAKLFIGLLTEKMIRISKTISPWGYYIPQEN